jgi:hypothetical protein
VVCTYSRKLLWGRDDPLSWCWGDAQRSGAGVSGGSYPSRSSAYDNLYIERPETTIAVCLKKKLRSNLLRPTQKKCARAQLFYEVLECKLKENTRSDLSPPSTALTYVVLLSSASVSKRHATLRCTSHETCCYRLGEQT